MRRIALASACLLLVASCGYKDPLDTSCDALAVQVLDRAIAPPANVSALVRVTDCHGGPLGRVLDDGAFVLSENGRVLSRFEAARLVAPAERQQSMRVLIALDLSGSIVRAELRPAMIEGAKHLVGALGAGHQVAIFGFDGRPDLVPFTYFTDDRARLYAALEEAGSAALVDDSTNLNGAVVNALRVLDRAVEADSRDVYTVAHGALVLFTDGQDLAGRVDGQTTLDALAATPHSTFAIGLGDDLDEGTLAAIGRTAHLRTADADGILGAFDQVGAELQARAQANYVVSYCSPARAGRRTLSIAVKAGELSGGTELEFDANGFGAGCAPEESPIH